MNWLLRLYPRAWRERYEDEFKALLTERDSSFLVIVDVVLAAVVAHWYALLRRVRQTPRWTLSIIVTALSRLSAPASPDRYTPFTSGRRRRHQVRSMASVLSGIVGAWILLPFANSNMTLVMLGGIAYFAATATLFWLTESLIHRCGRAYGTTGPHTFSDHDAPDRIQR